MVRIRPLIRSLVSVLALIPVAASAQIAGVNVNMVSGLDFPGGDPYLQRQNEGSITPTTRNALHLFGGANDYRTVDLPGLPDGEETGDAWLGVFKSLDGGLTWRSTLIPGYPQDTSAEGLAAPIRQTVNGISFPAAADPMVRAGLNGMLYYSGLAITRTNPPVGAVFVARYNDLNNHEASDPMQYVGMSIVADGRPGSKFYDKPSLAADLPRPGTSLCSVAGQFFLGGNVYVAYTDIQGSDANTVAKIWFSRSTNCGNTWSAPILVSGSNTINQGSVMAIDIRNGTLYVAWRRFAHGTETNAILIAKSIDGGKTFSTPVVIKSITPFEQGTTGASIRSTAYPTMVTDAGGRVYVAWSERTGPAGSVPGAEKPDGRIMLSNSPDGAVWSAPLTVAPTVPAPPLSGRGHQFMPALSYTSGKLMLVYYDLREDSTIGHYSPAPAFNQTRILLGNLASPSIQENVFNNYIQDAPLTGTLLRRHTLDVRASQSAPGAMPVFAASQRVSQYRFGTTSHTPVDANGKPLYIEQLDINPPNLKMFKLGTVPFFGDYIDVAPQYPFFGSIINLPFPAPVFHAVWTDNRDVRPPLDGNWANYTPVHSPANTGVSKMTGGTVPTCVVGQTGMRNQNIYTSRITAGLYFGSPGTQKPLGRIQRAFVVTVQNAKDVTQSYRLSIFNQPWGGKASFKQWPLNAPALTTLDVTLNRKSSTSRSVFVTSTIKSFPIGVLVTEITGVGGNPSPNGLTSATVLNTDPTAPDIVQPGTPGNPDIGNAEVYTPDIGNPGYVNPDIGNPDIGNPDIGNPDIGNPDIGNPDIGNPGLPTPDIGNPDIGNPDIGNPDIGNPDIGNGSVTDTNWDATDTGNTTASYSVKLLPTGAIDPTYKLQLILHQTYRTPVARGCDLGTERHEILIANVPHPTLSTLNNVGDPDIGNPTVPTVAIAPGDSVKITVRVVDPFHKGLTIPASNFLTPVIVAHGINTTDLGNANPQPRITLTITNPLPDGVTGTNYDATMQAIGGVPPLTWSVPAIRFGDFLNRLPAGMQMTSAGVISGAPTSPGTYTFIIQVTDSATPTAHATRQYTIHVANPMNFVGSWPAAVQGSPYMVTLGSTGGVPPIHWAVATGALPAGLTLSDGGTISGTATTLGSSFFQLRITDSSQPTPHTATSPTLQLDVIPAAARCGPTVTVLYDNSNIQAVSNGGTSPSFSTAEVSYCLDSIWTYHWNGGFGSTPGTIGLIGPNEQTLGPWQAFGSSGQGGAPNVNWTATPPTASPVILNGTYSVIDSNSDTWSQNAASSGNGFVKIYVRSYTPPQTYTVHGRLYYNGLTQTPAAPSFWLRNEDTGQQQNATMVMGEGNLFTISGLPAGNFGVEVISDENADGLFNYPGDFYSFTRFNSVVASNGGIDVTLTRVIHLTSPHDNSVALSQDFACPPSLTANAPTQISWDALDVAANYAYRIDVYTCPYAFNRNVVSGTTDGTSVTFPALAPSATGEFYQLTVFGYSAAASPIYVGQVMTHGTNGYAWDDRFRVPSP